MRPPSWTRLTTQSRWVPPFKHWKVQVNVRTTPLLAPIARVRALDPDTNSSTIFSTNSHFAHVEQSTGLLWLDGDASDLDELSLTVTVADADNDGLKSNKVVKVKRNNVVEVRFLFTSVVQIDVVL